MGCGLVDLKLRHPLPSLGRLSVLFPRQVNGRVAEVEGLSRRSGHQIVLTRPVLDLLPKARRWGAALAELIDSLVVVPLQYLLSQAAGDLTCIDYRLDNLTFLVLVLVPANWFFWQECLKLIISRPTIV